MKTFVIGLTLLFTLSAAAVAQRPSLPSSPIDIGALRRQVMARHFGPMDREDFFAEANLPAAEEIPAPIDAEWGLSFAPVPELLYLHCPKLKQDAGLLIDAVRPGSPAENASLTPGDIITGTEEKWIFSPEELPELDGPQNLIVLQAGKLCQVVVNPIAADEDGGAAAVEPETESAAASAPKNRVKAYSASTGSGGRSSASFASSSAGGGGEAISIACANGRYQIEASYATPDGPRKIQLNGTRFEIEKSLAQLPPSVKQAIERRLDFVSP